MDDVSGHDNRGENAEWFSVRCVFYIRWAGAYEERITLWQASGFAEAIALAEDEASDYADDGETDYVGLAQAYHMYNPPTHGAEVYSLMRTSDLDAETYLARFFDTGDERQGSI